LSKLALLVWTTGGQVLKLSHWETNGSQETGFKMKCDFCNRNKETIKTAIEYKGNDVFKFDSLVLTFDLCAQCVGENLSSVNGFAKAGN
jgi:hypothetical protein